MTEKKQAKQSPKAKTNNSKGNKQVKSKEPMKKSKSSSLVICSIVILILSVVLTMTFPYLKDTFSSLTNTATTATPAESVKTEKVANVVESQQDEFHPTLIINSDNNSGSKYEFKCTFEINETTKELVKRFPLTMKMVDLNRQEKYHTLEEPLPVRIQPVDKVRYGDILLFQSRYLAVFYETFDPVKQYSIIGKIDNPEKLKEAVGTGSITASFITNKKEE